MPRERDNYCWIPILNSVDFARSLLVSDAQVLKLDIDSSEHAQALIAVGELNSIKATIWGEPSDKLASNIEQLFRDVSTECKQYSIAYLLTNLSYYIVVALQFIVAVQINPVYTVDAVLNVGKTERQAVLLNLVLRSLVLAVVKHKPEWQENSLLLKYADKLCDSLDRMGMADLFSPLSKESLPLERLRELCGGRVQITGGALKWIIRDTNNLAVFESSDANSAVLGAVEALTK